VITDIKMTGLNGLELLEALHALAPDLRTIAMTAYTSSEIARRAEELSVQAYLTKPFMISEFREIVRSTLSAPIARRQPAPEAPTPFGAVPAQREEIVRALASLRAMTAAEATFLVRRDGLLVAADGLPAGKSASGLGAQLQTAEQAVAEQIAHLLDHRCSVRQSFYGSETYSVCTYRVNGSYTAVVLFGPEVREGQVWYYVREAAGAISRALGDGSPGVRSQARRGSGSLSGMLDQFLPRTRSQSAERASAAARRAPRTSSASLPPASQRPAAPAGFPRDAADRPETEPAPTDPLDANTAEPDVGEDEPVDLSILENMDWESADEMSWDAILRETDQGLDGLSFEEALGQGLLDDLEGA
jgi:DNA-binding NarL/FixJ family response regulator